jgi:predicted transposase/invertase (TIGR01784 family)
MDSEHLLPFTDTGFKLIFGTPENKILLLDFLNCLFKGERTIVDIEYQDKEQVNNMKDGRGIIYDIFCKTDTGEYIIVEMQNQRRSNFINRTVFYASQAIYRQGHKGYLWDYNIKDVYCVALMNFTDERFGDNLCTSAGLTIDGSGKQLSSLLRFYYIQLPLAKEDNADCVTSIESWTYILRNMDALKLPRYSDNKIFKHLKEVTDVASLSPKERARYDRDLKHFRDAYSLDKTYESILENAKNSMEKGREQGIIEGSIKKAFEIARNLKSTGLSTDAIAQATGLSIEEINAIEVN